MESNYNNNPRKRNRNIIWFNPPFSKNVATKIGRYFLNLLDPKKVVLFIVYLSIIYIYIYIIVRKGVPATLFKSPTP